MVQQLREFKVELIWLLIVGALSAIMLTETTAWADGHEEDLSSRCPPGGCECNEMLARGVQ